MMGKATTVAAFLLPLLLSPAGEACQRERRFAAPPTDASKRSVTPRAPLSVDEALLVDSVSSTTLDQWSYYYTHGQHLAGRNQTMAQWTADRWTDSGLNASVVSYDVWLNYPVSKSLSGVLGADGVQYQPTLAEDVLTADETTSYPDRVPTFHGYSASGLVEGAEYVYVGRGQKADFDRLEALGVPLEGRVALARYGGPFRGLKVRNAQDRGMVGAVIFTDPGDDGNVTEARGHAAYPAGPARNPSSVQRGSVQFLSVYPGDPTTPGHPSLPGAARGDGAEVLPRIPSLPISQADAAPLLAALAGHGPSGEEVGREGWVGGGVLPGSSSSGNGSYWTGPVPGAKLRLENRMEGVVTPIWNAIGVINGTAGDETVVVGNHRDAWVVGGAADPNSGSAIVTELARALGGLLETGWRPRRTIVLASWDGEEYGLVGSTEWVEEYLPWLTGTAVSYLNVDVGVSGPRPGISATPELHAAAREAMRKVLWMDSGRTMFDVWSDDTGGEGEGEVGVLGSGSDYTAFVHNGIGSIDMGADGGPDDPIYHYHSNYDSYHWMATLGDPGFLAHKSMTQYLALLTYSLASPELIPFDLPNYSAQMELYWDDLVATVDAAGAGADLDLSPLRVSLDEFRGRADAVEKLAQQAAETADAALVREVNTRYRDFQRGFVSQGGLPNRTFYK